jgi:hypothetical protein
MCKKGGEEIHVTKENIMEGEPQEASYCAIACAIADEYGVNNRMVGVTDCRDIYIDYGQFCVDLIVEPEYIDTVKKFIDDFDYIDQLEEGDSPDEYKNNLKEFTFKYRESLENSEERNS